MSGLKSQFVELVNDTKIQLTANGLNKTLSQAVIDGDLSSGAPTSLDVLYSQSFENIILSNFDQVGSTLYLTDGLSGKKNLRITHGTTTQYFKDTFRVGRKFRGLLWSMSLNITTNALPSNITITLRDETNSVDITTTALPNPTSTISKQTIYFQIPATCSSLSYKINCLAEAGKITEIDDIVFVENVTYTPQVALTQDADSMYLVSSFSYQSASNGVLYFTDGTSQFVGSHFQRLASTSVGDSFKMLKDAYVSANLLIEMGGTAGYVYLMKNSTTQLAACYESGSASLASLNWDGPLKTGDIITLVRGASVTSFGANSANTFSLSAAGSLKQVTTNYNQKIDIPTSEVIINGSGRVGTVGSMTNIVSMSGDNIVIDQTAGTKFSVRRKAKVTITGNATVPSGAWTMFVMKNGFIVNAQATPNVNYNVGVTWSGDLLPTDSIWLDCNSSPGGIIATVTAQELSVQVGVSNTLPQYSESDVVLRAQLSNGSAVTADTTNIPFNAVINTDGAWNGTQYTVQRDGVYFIAGRVRFSTSATRILNIYKNGSMYRQTNTPATDTAAYGTFVDYFTKGEVISLRVSGTGGTLQDLGLQETTWLTIAQIGKPNVTGVNVNPFVDTTSIAETLAVYTVSGIGTNGSGTDMVNMNLAWGGLSDLLSYAPSTGLFTALKPCYINAEISGIAASANGLFVYIIDNTNATGRGDETNGNAGSQSSLSKPMYLQTGEQFKFRIYHTASDVTCRLHARTAVSSISVADTGKVGEVIWSIATTAPVGFIPADLKSIGLSSGNYTGQKYFNLYSTIWALPNLSTVAGNPFYISAAKGTSALADWNAGKTITVDFATNEVFVRQKGSARDLGSYQADAFQGHRHGFSLSGGWGAGAADGGRFRADQNSPANPWGGTVLDPSSDGINGTPRTASETRPRNVALNAYIRFSAEMVNYTNTPVKFQTKTLTSNVTAAVGGSTVITALGFNNLVIGKTYEVNFNAAFQQQAVSAGMSVEIANGSTLLAHTRNYSSDNTASGTNGNRSATKMFTATATTLTFTLNNVAGTTAIISGDPTIPYTYSQLKEIPAATEVTDWT